MRLRSDGRRTFSPWELRAIRALRKLRSALTLVIDVQDKNYRSTFAGETEMDAFRPLSLWIKEEGTMRWIDENVRPGDRFLDVGANIGIYTIAAAHRVGPLGKVYAVEPHKMNALSLMRNVLLNRFSDRVEIVTLPLSDARRTAQFNYYSLESGSSGSQLGSTRLLDNSFPPALSELVMAVSLDELLEGGAIEPPDLIKIDVDGLELGILEGMRRLLTSERRPRAVQVEINIGEGAAVERLLSGCGYALSERHHTMHGQSLIDAGEPISRIAHNAVFVPRGLAQ